MPKYGEFAYGDGLYEEGSGVSDFGFTNGLSHRFNVSHTDLVYAGFNTVGGLQTTVKRNQFDEFGDVVSMRRLPGEPNWEFRRRLKDSMVHFANASYRGMVYGITHELGLSLYRSILVNPKVDNNGRFLAPDPYIRFDGPRLYLYSDYANSQLDFAIDRYEAGGNYEHVQRLVDAINETGFFEAERPARLQPFDRSMTILNQSSRRIVTFERLPASRKFRLRHRHLVRGTVFFANRDTFRTEVTTEDAIQHRGEYFVDYDLGIVKVFTVPTFSDIVRYQYTEYPFRTVASPVIVHDVTNESFRTKMFEQIQLDDGLYAHGKPTEIGVDIINELLTVVPMYWGV